MTERLWSKQDDGDLKRMMRECRPIKEAAATLERSVEDVAARLKLLGSRMPGAGTEPPE